MPASSYIPQTLAASFAATTGIDRDDLLQEASLAYWRARSGGAYDPHFAAFNTFATHCVYRHLCSVARTGRRYPQHEELQPNDNRLSTNDPSPEDRLIFAEMLRDLPEDARTVVSLILGDAQAMASLTRAAAKRALKKALPWPPHRLEAAFSSITEALVS